MNKSLDFSSASISSLPSALWVFSTAVFSTRIEFKKPLFWYLLVGSPLAFSFTLEFLQYYHFTDGTYDQADLSYSLMGWLSALIVAKLYDLLPQSIKLNSQFLLVFYSILFLANVY